MIEEMKQFVKEKSIPGNIMNQESMKESVKDS